MAAHDCTLMYRTFLISHIVDDYQNHLKQLLLLTFTTITTFTAGYHHQNHVIFQKPVLVTIGDEKKSRHQYHFCSKVTENRLRMILR